MDCGATLSHKIERLQKLWDKVYHILTTTGLLCRTEEQVEMGDTETKKEVVQACPSA